MPLPSEMGLAITPADKTTITTALNTALATLNAIKVVQLTASERQGAQSVADTRFPFVQKGIKALAPAYPNLQPGYLNITTADTDLETATTILQFLLTVKEISDRFTDFGLASEHFAYQYVRKFYAGAQEAQAVNTPGADTVVDELKGLFEGQGQTNPGSPTPGPGTPP